MRDFHDTPTLADSRDANQRCNHPLAFIIDPTDREISELEKMLADCPNCSRWSPGDGPIMAVVSSHNGRSNGATKDTIE